MNGIWPGTQAGYTTPPGAMVSSMQRQPMFGEYMGPQYTGPFNMGSVAGSPQLGMLAQLAMPLLARGVMGPGVVPMQFNPWVLLDDQPGHFFNFTAKESSQWKQHFNSP